MAERRKRVNFSQGKYQMDLAFNGKSTNIREAIVKFNHDDDSYEVVAHGATPDMLSAIEENIK